MPHVAYSCGADCCGYMWECPTPTCDSTSFDWVEEEPVNPLARMAGLTYQMRVADTVECRKCGTREEL